MLFGETTLYEEVESPLAVPLLTSSQKQESMPTITVINDVYHKQRQKYRNLISETEADIEQGDSAEINVNTRGMSSSFPIMTTPQTKDSRTLSSSLMTTTLSIQVQKIQFFTVFIAIFLILSTIQLVSVLYEESPVLFAVVVVDSLQISICCTAMAVMLLYQCEWYRLEKIRAQSVLRMVTEVTFQRIRKYQQILRRLYYISMIFTFFVPAWFVVQLSTHVHVYMSFISVFLLFGFPPTITIIVLVWIYRRLFRPPEK